MMSVSVATVWSQQELRALAAIGASAGNSTSSFGATLRIQQFLKDQGNRMIDIINRNIVNRGQGGDWPALTPAYELRKLAGKTPGHAKFGAPAMLRDSGKSASEITYKVNVTRDVSLDLLVPEIQLYHWHGVNGRVRNPWTLADQAAFEATFNRDLDAFLSGVFT